MSASVDEVSQPVTVGEFASWMAAFGPFERRPHVAVGCSGGGDSMALTLLLDRWVRSHGGKLTALTVDHRLRPDSADEARRVGAWLAARKIDHIILARSDTPVTGNLQAAARAARYALMSAWCAGHGVLHLVLAHHREDQAETVLLRLARGSGVDGLSAMAPVTETPDLRLLRPLLAVPRARLARTLEAAGQPHVDDPSNNNAAFGRVRLRQAAALLDREGLTAARLSATAMRMARARSALEEATARLLSESVTLHPEGYATLDPAPFRTASDEIALRGLSRVLTTVSGRDYPPRFESIERVWRDWLAETPPGAARTLGGCRLIPQKGDILICREPRAADSIVPMGAGEVFWDGRFRIRIAGKSRCDVRRLGRTGWSKLTAECPELRTSAVPAAVRPSLPSFWHLDDVLSVPHLKYVRHGAVEDPPTVREMSFAPRRPLTGAGSFLDNRAVKA